MNKPWSEIERLERRVKRQLLTIKILGILTVLLSAAILGVFLTLGQKKARSWSCRQDANSLTLKSIQMQSKTTTNSDNPQHLIAGLNQNDSSIEFFGFRETKTVKFLQNGQTHDFKELPPAVFVQLLNAYNSNSEAKKFLGSKPVSTIRKVELFTYYVWGDLDADPDYRDGALQDPENFRHTYDCPSLQFKKLQLNGAKLKPREVVMIDLFGKDYKDEVVAMEMGITRATLSQHKRELFDKTGTGSKLGLVLEASRKGILIQDKS